MIGTIIGWSIPNTCTRRDVVEVSNTLSMNIYGSYLRNDVANRIAQHLNMQPKSPGYFVGRHKDYPRAVCVYEQRNGGQTARAEVKLVIRMHPDNPYDVDIFGDPRITNLVKGMQFTYSGTAIGNAIARYLMNYGAIRVRRSGGTYFVPEHYRFALDRALEAIAKVGGERTIFYVTGHPDEQESIVQSFFQHLNSLVQDFTRRLSEVKTQRGLESLARSGVLESLDTLRVYGEILDRYSDDIKQALAQANNIITNQLRNAQLRVVESGKSDPFVPTPSKNVQNLVLPI